MLAINPMLEPEQIGELLRAANVKILVTLKKTPKVDIWEKVQVAVQMVPSIERVLVCSVFDWMGSGALPVALRASSRARATVKQSLRVGERNVPVSRLMKHVNSARGDKLEFEPPKGSDVSTMLCTGGTTGLPKIACRTHFSEVFDSWAMSRFNPEALAAGTTSLCGLPLFHSNAIMVTGLLCFMVGAHVVVASPAGYRGDGIMPHFWDIVSHYKVAAFVGVPMVYFGAVGRFTRGGGP